ncbi:hypothetical protein NW752_007130 [Fusarium irregulare]|nr:hypothetical protein NW752_007130 [Fusarium irregulare]
MHCHTSPRGADCLRAGTRDTGESYRWGQEESFPGPDNQSKMKHSVQNAENPRPYETGEDDLWGQEEPFRGPDNQSKMKHSEESSTGPNNIYKMKSSVEIAEHSVARLRRVTWNPSGSTCRWPHSNRTASNALLGALPSLSLGATRVLSEIGTSKCLTAGVRLIRTEPEEK